MAEAAGAVGLPFAPLLGVACRFLIRLQLLFHLMLLVLLLPILPRLGAGVLETDNLGEVQQYLEGHLGQLSADLASLQGGVGELQGLAR